MKNKIVSTFLVAFLFLAYLTGCKSVPDRVKELSDNSYFQEASTIISEEQTRLSKNPDLDKLKELEQARRLFDQSISAHFSIETEKLNSRGKIREALKVSFEAYRLCPWSDTIKYMLARYKDKVAALDKLQDKWRIEIMSGNISPKNSRRAILDLSATLSDMSDSPDLNSLYALASNGVLSYWADRLNEKKLRLASTDQSEMIADLHRLLIDRDKSDKIENVIRSLQALVHPNSTDTSATDQNSIPADVVDALYANPSPSVFDTQTLVLRQVLQSQFEDWILTVYSKCLLIGNVSFETIRQSELLLESIAPIKANESFRHALSLAHINRARQFLKGGIVTNLAFFFLQRSMQLEDASINAIEIDNVDRKARSYLSTTKYPSFGLSLDVDPTISLDTQNIIYSAFSSSFLSRSKEDRPWRLVSSGSTDQDVSVTISSAEIAVPNLAALPRVNSQYLSHFETVPNPAKESLQFQLTWAKSNIELAKSSYDRAVSSYNWDPNEWNLSNVNSAYNRYKWAIDSYNSLVDTYNFTPSTVEQPVYLPYSFAQGNVKFGCKLSVKCRIGSRDYWFSSQSMDTCSVRYGSKSTDTNQSTRRDISLTFNVSIERLLAHLNSAVNEICDQINPLLTRLNYPTYIPLSDNEITILQCLMHPWGFDKSALKRIELPKWEKEALSSVSIAQLQLNLPSVPLQVNKNKIKGPMQTAVAVKTLEPLVCLIESVTNSDIISIGSGTIVGPNGLVLTCGHVLNSPAIKVKFLSGKNRGSYEGEIVFVNEKCDVALIRAKKLFNDDWATIRLKTSAAKGERILAIGNPSIGQAAMNIGGASAGIVSNPKVNTFGQEALIADITVASGSSGGPLFSLENGDLIGVVLAVTRPGINVEGVSSSGSYCLAAPADMLGSWLGLQYTP